MPWFTLQTYLSINFLPNALYYPERCIRSMQKAAQRYDFPVNPLIFETIEAEHVDNNRHLTHILREYRDYGFMAATDYLGAGCSGLNPLADFQPDRVKLDMALIRDTNTDKNRQIIVRGLVTILEGLGVKIIAEGIKTATERDFLAYSGNYLVQGFWFTRPGFKTLLQVNDNAWIVHE